MIPNLKLNDRLYGSGVEQEKISNLSYSIHLNKYIQDDERGSVSLFDATINLP